MRFSIIVPVYNVEAYLSGCIDSILAQEFTDYELILVEDASTDSSKQICESYVSKYPDKIKLMYGGERPSGGPGEPRNRGLTIATGEYLFFADSDDKLYKSALSDINKCIESTAADMVVFGFTELDQKDRVLSSYVPAYDGVISEKERGTIIYQTPSVWNKVYSRKMFDELGILFTSGVWYEDVRVVPKYLCKAGVVACVSKSLYKYYKYDGSIMNSNNVQKNIQIIDAIEDTREYLKGSLYEEEMEFMAIERAYVDASGRILSIKKDKKLLDKIRNYIKTNYIDYKKNKYIKTLNKKQKIIYRLMNIRAYGLLRCMFLFSHLITGKRVKKRVER